MTQVTCLTFRSLFNIVADSIADRTTHGEQPSGGDESIDLIDLFTSILRPEHFQPLCAGGSIPGRCAFVADSFPSTACPADAATFNQFCLCADSSIPQLRLLGAHIEQGKVQNVVVFSQNGSTITRIIDSLDTIIRRRPKDAHETRNSFHVHYVSFVEDPLNLLVTRLAPCVIHDTLRGKHLQKICEIGVSQPVFTHRKLNFRLVVCTFVLRHGPISARPTIQLHVHESEMRPQTQLLLAMSHANRKVDILRTINTIATRANVQYRYQRTPGTRTILWSFLGLDSSMSCLLRALRQKKQVITHLSLGPQKEEDEYETKYTLLIGNEASRLAFQRQIEHHLPDALSDNGVLLQVARSSILCSLHSADEWCHISRVSATTDPCPDIWPVLVQACTSKSAALAFKVGLPFASWPLPFSASHNSSSTVQPPHLANALAEKYRCKVHLLNLPIYAHDVQLISGIVFLIPADEAQAVVHAACLDAPTPLAVGPASLLVHIKFYYGPLTERPAPSVDTGYLSMLESAGNSNLRLNVQHVALPATVNISYGRSQSTEHDAKNTRLTPIVIPNLDGLHGRALSLCDDFFHPHTFAHAQLPKRTLVISKLAEPTTFSHAIKSNPGLLYDKLGCPCTNVKKPFPACSVLRIEHGTRTRINVSATMPIALIAFGPAEATYAWSDQQGAPVLLRVLILQAAIVSLAKPKWIDIVHCDTVDPTLFHIDVTFTSKHSAAGHGIIVHPDAHTDPDNDNPFASSASHEHVMHVAQPSVEEIRAGDHQANESGVPPPRSCFNVSVDLGVLLLQCCALHTFGKDGTDSCFLEAVARVRACPYVPADISHDWTNKLRRLLAIELPTEEGAREEHVHVPFIDEIREYQGQRLAEVAADAILHLINLPTKGKILMTDICTIFAVLSASISHSFDATLAHAAAGLHHTDVRWHFSHIVALTLLKHVNCTVAATGDHCIHAIATNVRPLLAKLFQAHVDASELRFSCGHAHQSDVAAASTDLRLWSPAELAIASLHVLVHLASLYAELRASAESDALHAHDAIGVDNVACVDSEQKDAEMFDTSADIHTSVPKSVHLVMRMLYLCSLFDGLGCARIGIDRYLRHFQCEHLFKGAIAAELDFTALTAMLSHFGRDAKNSKAPFPLVFRDVWHILGSELLILANLLAQIPFSAVIVLVAGSPCQNLTFAGAFQGALGLTGSASSNFFVIPLLLFAIQQLRPDICVVLVGENAGSMREEFKAAFVDLLRLPSRAYLPAIDTASFSEFKRNRVFPGSLPFSSAEANNPFLTRQTSPFEDAWAPLHIPLPPMMRSRPIRAADGLHSATQALKSLYQYHPKFLLYTNHRQPDWNTLLASCPEAIRGFNVFVQKGDGDAKHEDRQDQIKFEDAVRPFALWIEKFGRANGVRAPSGKERLRALTLADLDQEGSMSEKELTDLTGNTFHPNLIAARLHGDGQLSLHAILTGLVQPDPPAYYSPAALAQKYDDLRQTVCADERLVAHAVIKPFPDSCRWTQAKLDAAATAAQPRSDGNFTELSHHLVPGRVFDEYAIKPERPNAILSQGSPVWQTQRALWKNRVVKSFACTAPRDEWTRRLDQLQGIEVAHGHAALRCALIQAGQNDKFLADLPGPSVLTWQLGGELPCPTANYRKHIEELWTQCCALQGAYYNLWIHHVRAASPPFTIHEGDREIVIEVVPTRPWILLLSHHLISEPYVTLYVTANSFGVIAVDPSAIPLAKLLHCTNAESLSLRITPEAKWARAHGLIPSAHANSIHANTRNVRAHIGRCLHHALDLPIILDGPSASNAGCTPLILLTLVQQTFRDRLAARSLHIGVICRDHFDNASYTWASCAQEVRDPTQGDPDGWPHLVFLAHVHNQETTLPVEASEEELSAPQLTIQLFLSSHSLGISSDVLTARRLVSWRDHSPTIVVPSSSADCATHRGQAPDLGSNAETLAVAPARIRSERSRSPCISGRTVS